MMTKAPRASGTLKLHPGQLRIYNSSAPITLAVGGIRSGKTHGGAVRTLVKEAMAKPCAMDECHAVASPTYPMSTVPVEKIAALLYDKRIFPQNPLIRYYKRDRMFHLRCTVGGTTKIRVFSMHEPDRARGFKVWSVWYDEGAYGTEYSWEVLQGRLADTNGRALITTTPNGYNWVYSLYERALNEQTAGVPAPERTVRVIHFTSLENTFIKERAGMDRLINSYDEKTYNQEVLARFVKDAGLVYYAFTRHRNIVPGRLDLGKPLWVGQDFNVGAMASVIGQPFTNQAGEKGVHFIAERRVENSGTFELIQFLNKFCETNHFPKSKVKIFPDASGGQRSTSGKSDFYLLKKAGYDLDVGPTNPFIRDRVNSVNTLLAPRTTRYPRLLVDPSCVSIIETCEKQGWNKKVDPPMPDKTQGLDHIGDAIGYLVWRKFPLKNPMTVGTDPALDRKVA